MWLLRTHRVHYPPSLLKSSMQKETEILAASNFPRANYGDSSVGSVGRDRTPRIDEDVCTR